MRIDADGLKTEPAGQAWLSAKSIGRRSMNMQSRLLAFAILILPFALFSVQAHAAGESIEYQLACINAGRRVAQDDITVARFRSLLRQLSHTFVEDPQQIADMSVKGLQMLKQDGISESLLNIMEGMNQLFSTKVANQKYAELIAAYLTLRDKGQSHTQAIAGLQGILRGMGIY